MEPVRVRLLRKGPCPLKDPWSRCQMAINQMQIPLVPSLMSLVKNKFIHSHFLLTALVVSGLDALLLLQRSISGK